MKFNFVDTGRQFDNGNNRNSNGFSYGSKDAASFNRKRKAEFSNGIGVMKQVTLDFVETQKTFCTVIQDTFKIRQNYSTVPRAQERVSERMSE